MPHDKVNKDTAKCPMSLDEVDLFEPGAQNFWYDSYKILHRESPVHKIPGEGTSPGTDGFVLSKYEDIAFVVKDILRFPPPVMKNTDLEKAGVDYTATTSAGIDVIVSQQFEEEVRQAQKVAPLFREIAVSSGATVLPLAPDAGAATFSGAGIGDSSNQLSDAGDNNYTVSQVILQAHRLIAGTYISNDTDEQIVLTVLPIVTSALARAHAVAIDKALLVGSGAGNISKGLAGDNGADDGGGYGDAASALVSAGGNAAGSVDASTTEEVVPADLLQMRKEMGKYGMDPSRVAYIVPNDVYFELIDQTGFTDVSEVGNDLATKLIGQVGSIFGSPVIATNQLANNNAAGGSATTTAALAVNMDNYVIPRLRGVNIETEYSVKDQQNVIVASQSLGFAELFDASGSDIPAVRLPWA